MSTITPFPEHPPAGGRDVVVVATVPADLVCVCELATRVAAGVASAISPIQAGLLELGLTEALTNIVRHGYHGKPGQVFVAATRDADTLFITICDRGQRIPQQALDTDPQAAFNFDPDDLDSIPEGGMGIGLIKKTFSALHYDVRGDLNTMSLELKLVAELQH